MGDTPTDFKAVRSGLRDEIHQLNKKVDAVDHRNQEDHQAILVQIMDLISDKKALRLMGILVGVALGSALGLLLWAAD
jgi:hypothetical protein